MKANKPTPHMAQAMLNTEQHAELKALMAAYDMGESAVIRHLIASAYEMLSPKHEVFGEY